MALSDSVFGNAGGAVSDLFGAFGAEQNANLKAESLDLKAKGDLAEAQQYDLADQYTKTIGAVQSQQQQRSTTMQIGGQQAAQAGAGFAASGSGLDILADSASQGALAKATIQTGTEEKSESYELMANTARMTAAGEEQIANETRSAGQTAMWGDIAGGLLKGAAAVAGLATGTGLFGDLASAAVGGFSPSAPTDSSDPLVINRYGTPAPTSNNPAKLLGSIY
ncbi:hypothetical protein [Bradyrhizobium erythrophlei]|jgi:hypothetical protein|uniref:Uncharacterized protein n=1 Tax=Bradyrhizobium erythrophlei TaxID=1437360 RepID=A0A1M7USY4_9BRAD|nr:hypothetical protein [Bradyrhizobium erythrophlei]SHN86006.1 hypothetical protein SAMN05444170_6519 [Bradyrhizobium erythrophlei]